MKFILPEKNKKKWGARKEREVRKEQLLGSSFPISHIAFYTISPIYETPLSFPDFYFVHVCLCVLFDLIFVRALNTPLLYSAIFHPVYSH